MMMNTAGSRSLLWATFLSVLAFAATLHVIAQEQPPLPTISPVPPQRIVPPPPQDQLFTETEKTTTRIVPIEYADTNDLINILQLFGVRVIANDNPRAIVLSGAEGAVNLALDAVEQLDVPPPPVKNVEVIVNLVVATKGGEIAPGLEPCGPQLDPVVEQLNAVFGFEQFALVDTLLLRGRDGSGIEASGFLTSFAAMNDSGQALPSQYQFRVDDLRVQSMPDAVARISLNRLVFSTELSIPTPTGAGPNGQRFTQISRQQMGISADLDVQEGQMAIVGKANVSTQGEVVFVVVSAKVVTERGEKL
jgi:hypothetical protein